MVVEIATHARDVARDAQRIIDSVREGVGKAWFAHRLAVEPGADRDAVRVRCAALLRVEKVRTTIEATDADGMFPADLNDWERTVVASELARDGFVAWYRNPGSATPASLRIAYQNDEGDWASLQPDFIVVSRRTDGTLGASIVDPHGDYLADARAKLHALAAFAERFGDRFVRIESVAKVEDGSLRVLDLGDPAVRAEVRAFEGGKVTALYQSEHSRPYL